MVSLGIALAFAANFVSPRRVVLSWDYFGKTAVQGTQPLRHAPQSSSSGSSAGELLAARLGEQGMRVIHGSEARQLFSDRRFLQQDLVFIDALNAREYGQGHIPGAFRFDPYDPDGFAGYMAEVLPACEAAKQIVIYCNGGDCDASERAAQILVGAGVPPGKLLVYAGGIAEWKRNRLPLETGARDSGQISNATP